MHMNRFVFSIFHLNDDGDDDDVVVVVVSILLFYEPIPSESFVWRSSMVVCTLQMHVLDVHMRFASDNVYGLRLFCINIHK